MTNYRSNDLNDEWEFKIVRSAMGAFKKPHVLQQVIEEEQIAGWTLLEKFDDSRLRFKRPASARRKDNMLPQGIDPYRTAFGMSESALGAWIVVSVVLGLAVFATVMIILDARGVL